MSRKSNFRLSLEYRSKIGLLILHFVIYIVADFGLATYFSAVCVESNGVPRVQIQINKADLNATAVEDQLQMIIDGDEIDIGLIPQESNTSVSLDGVDSNLLFKRSNTSLTVLFSSGISITVASSSVSMEFHTKYRLYAHYEIVLLTLVDVVITIVVFHAIM